MTSPVIWKFHLPFLSSRTDAVEIEMPYGAQILSLQLQHEQPHVWALINNPEAPKQRRKFTLVGTGHPFESLGKRFVGTFQLQGGAFVFHVFEVVEVAGR